MSPPAYPRPLITSAGVAAALFVVASGVACARSAAAATCQQQWIELRSRVAAQPAVDPLSDLGGLLERCPTLVANEVLPASVLGGWRETRGFQELIRRHAPIATATIAAADEPGPRLVVHGTVADAAGRPISGALVYAFHTDRRGWYVASGAGVGEDTPRLFGYVRTGADGGYQFSTIRPARYPDSRVLEHVHVTVTADGFSGRRTETFFSDDPLLTAEGRESAARRGYGMCDPTPGKLPSYSTAPGAATWCRFDVTLER